MVSQPELNMQFGGLSAQDCASILSILRSFAAVEQVKLFGSRALGTFHPGSDVDLALFGEGINSDIVRRISYLLNQEGVMPYTFDIVDATHSSHEQLLDHINRVGINLL
jgi:predicted nucleotidyltransferase